MEPIHNNFSETNKQNTSLAKKEWHKPEITKISEISETENTFGPNNDGPWNDS
jgi:hypothetical protein